MKLPQTLISLSTKVLSLSVTITSYPPILLPVHVAAAAVIALHHHAAPVAGHEVPVLHVVRTRVVTRALTLAPGWTRVKEVEVGAEAGDITRAVHEVHGVVIIVIIGHFESDYSEAILILYSLE